MLLEYISVSKLLFTLSFYCFWTLFSSILLKCSKENSFKRNVNAEFSSGHVPQ